MVFVGITAAPIEIVALVSRVHQACVSRSSFTALSNSPRRVTRDGGLARGPQTASGGTPIGNPRPRGFAARSHGVPASVAGPAARGCRTEQDDADWNGRFRR